MRLNPLNGRWVTIVAERAERPSDFARQIEPVESDPGRPCPFCPGNEDITPSALETVGVGGKWDLRVIPNKYPAFVGDDPFAVHHLGPVHIMAEASGIHEVFVYTPDHSGSLDEFDDAKAEQIMQALRRRFIDHANAPHIRYTQAIVNHGREAGASIAHPHGQLLGLPFIPGEIIEEERAFSRFESACILCATVEAELTDGKRVIVASEDALVICPFWSGVPYEMLVIPRQHDVHLQDANDESLAAVGVAIRDALAQLNEVFGDVSFNLVFHTAPHHHTGSFHWHAHIWPKITTIAGFERGTGVMINIVSPEHAAEQLRRVAIST